MTLQLKLQKFGNDLGFVVPSEALTELQAKEGDVVQFRLESPSDELEADLRIAEEAMTNYDQTFRDLAR